VKNLENPSVAEDRQRRKLQFVPPMWPLLLIVVVVVVVAIVIEH
jgi:hypothetical protein